MANCKGNFYSWLNLSNLLPILFYCTPQIPFSKFFLASKGRVQDKQYEVPLHRISAFGISVSGRAGHEGPFSLEIDYIGLELDPTHTETFEYESYKTDKYVFGV